MTDTNPNIVTIRLSDAPGRRLDKAIATAVPAELALSRSRLSTLIQDGAVSDAKGRVFSNPSATPEPGLQLFLTLPPIEPIRAQPQAIPLDVLFEDADVIVVDKPAGMVVHPGAGTPDGTLVNALLAHCGSSLSGIGGAQRPGIVHRIDKDTSGLLVVAKNDAAHQFLAAQFAEHSVLRRYQAICWGTPERADARLNGLPGVKFSSAGDLTIDLPIARHPSDRKKMATRNGGKRAVTHVSVQERLGSRAAFVTCELETGRTHQIRVHMSVIGHPLIGDPVYGKNRRWSPEQAQDPRLASFDRQALHAGRLGFVHPKTEALMEFECDLPKDFTDLKAAISHY